MTSPLTLVAFAATMHVVVTWLRAAWRGAQADRVRQTVPSQGDWPFVTVVIPAWQELSALGRCIDSLADVSYPAWEVVIVAGGSDGTYEVAKERCREMSRIRVLEQEPNGKNAALNRGIAVALGDVVVLLDADSQVTPDWLRSLVAPLRQGAMASTGQARPIHTSAISRGEEMERMSAYEVRGSTTLQGSASIALHREVIEQLGGLPESVTVGVDWDLDARLASAGVVRAYASAAVVFTDRPFTLAQYWRNEVRWRRAHIASIVRFRSYFLRDFASAVRSLYLYGLAWTATLFTLVVASVLILGPGAIASSVISVWGLFLGWILLRRAALAVEVAAYQRDRRRLRDAWVPPVLLLVTFGAICVASLTPGRSTMHFKGPRDAIAAPR